MNRWPVLLLLGLCLVARAGHADLAHGIVRIGVLNDQSSVFADSSGPGSVMAARMAAEDFGRRAAGVPIEIIAADHQNKPDVGSAIARKWFDEDGVDAVADLGNSAVALAVVEVAKAKDRAALISGGASTALTGSACSPITVQWTFDSWALANALATTLVKAGNDSWFFLAADYAYGHDLERTTVNFVTAAGGTVLGSALHPLGAADFASWLLQAQAAHAKVIAFANGGNDTVNATKQAREFGLGRDGQKLVLLSATISDIQALGLDAAQGLLVAESFYWNETPAARAWSERWSKAMNGRMPTMIQAGVYAVVTHYLKAVAEAKTTAGRAVVAAMKALPTDDALFGRGTIRQDGRKLHDMHVFQVKAPAESKEPWDYYKLVGTVPAARAFRPIERGGCPLIK
jgi:branched-chain amino acid transport system substrate-binding protein